MKVTINGEEKELESESLTVSELLKSQKVEMPDMVTVELNGEILDREAYDSATVTEGNTVEFLYFMGGGIL